jgi:glycosyltransferase involved in cell wall biosynthesis
MISVIIPVLNESERVGSVIEFAKAGPNVSEVIVEDDGSIDGTPELAREAGAAVLTSTLLGKGASIQDGLRAAKNDIVH